MHGSLNRPRDAGKGRKQARSRVVRDFARDWQRWTRAERLTAGALFAAVWLAISDVQLTAIFHSV
jgi:hypothetical protein